MLRRLIFTLLVTLGASGCVIEADDRDQPREYGPLRVDWTIDGTKATAACHSAGADTISIAISTERGRLLQRLEEPCEAFDASVELLPGTYVVGAALLDADGDELTSTVADSVLIYPDVVSFSAFDFPRASFATAG